MQTAIFKTTAIVRNWASEVNENQNWWICDPEKPSPGIRVAFRNPLVEGSPFFRTVSKKKKPNKELIKNWIDKDFVIFLHNVENIEDYTSITYISIDRFFILLQHRFMVTIVTRDLNIYFQYGLHGINAAICKFLHIKKEQITLRCALINPKVGQLQSAGILTPFIQGLLKEGE